jgi:dephospho-CoA kinase
MKVLGLTGGIGMGKSTAAGLLSEMGTSVVDTDRIAHELVEPGQPALEEIRQCFGPDVIGKEGQLDRAELAQRVFRDPEARKRLEAILHPRIRAIWTNRVAQWREAGIRIAVVVIPLLFETDAAAEFDVTVSVACSTAAQWARLRARGWSDAQITERIQAQWSIEKKMQAADFVTWAEGPLAVHADQWRRIIQTLAP